MDTREHLINAIARLDKKEALDYTKAMLDAGVPRERVLDCLNAGDAKVHQLFDQGEYFIADLIVSGMIYQDVFSLITPAAEKTNAPPVGRVVIGVVEGDIHDIGKDIVVSLLRVEHIDVVDLGVDVCAERFVHAVETYHPDVVLLSGVLTFDDTAIAGTIQMLREKQLRNQLCVLIGGLCASEHLKTSAGADAWAYNPVDTVAFCKKVIGERHEKEK
jgi:methanogenic corrinoid protein MtbC1